MKANAQNQQASPQTFSVADLIEWYRRDLLELNPVFQRRSVWSSGARSFLIDTILRGLPVPALILRELKTNLRTLERKREVVDGQQRLRALIAYILPANKETQQDAFTLSETHQPDHKNSSFQELPADLRTSILEYRLHVHVLPSTTTNGEVLDMFSRLNATGYQLKAQELRNAKFYGYFKTVSYAVASDYFDFWERREVFSEIDINRMREVEFTSELLSMMIYGVMGLSQKKLDKVYADHDKDAKFAKTVPSRFGKVIRYLDENFPFSDLKYFSRKSLFYPLFAVTYNEMFEVKSGMVKPKAVSAAAWKTILANASKMQSLKVPKHVASSIESQPTNLKERQVLIRYLRHGK